MTRKPPRAVLVVDDNPDYRRIVSRILASGGYAALAAASAEEARALLAARTPDAAILDWNLPGESGVELSRWLRREPRFAALPLIMISVNARPEDQVQGLREGELSAYMVKPFEPAALLARLQALLERKAGSR
ncbi:MAG: response regulator [Elusimicrobia bacterium]|nr:response regulator [Elusimicrobiota bacterium]